MSKFKKDDLVRIIAGRDKGKEGKILAVIRNNNNIIEKLIVENANKVSKHVKPNPNVNEQGGIKQIEKPIQASNVAHVDPSTGKVSKVGYKFVEAENKFKRKVRYYKASGELLDA